jgi:hypothetical protein
MIGDKEIIKAIKIRCKDCRPDNDEESLSLCKKCKLKTKTKRAVLSYCKDCRNGNPLEVCKENLCPFLKLVPELSKEISEQLKGKKN